MKLVLDTNVVLDLFVFNDAAVLPLHAELMQGGVHWIATRAMRDELERVLAYEHIRSRLVFYGLEASAVLERFDRHVQVVEVPVKSSAICRDPDDQIFVDLAVAHGCMVLSKDAAVLALKKRLIALGADVVKPQTALGSFANRRTYARPAPFPGEVLRE